MPTPEENIQSLKGRYVTYVCRIDDPVLWSAENPMHTNRVAGCAVVGMSVGDLMGYSDALEELMPAQFELEVRKLQEKYCSLP